MMDTKLIEEIIDILNEDESSMIPRPATDEDIALCNKDLDELGLLTLPEEYVAFLKLNNGLAWNGIEFYSTDQVVEADNPDGYKLMDLVTMNDDFNDRYELDECLLIGRADEDYYTYNTKKKVYEVRDVSAVWDVYYDCESFAELFVSEVGGRLGLNQYSEPAPEQN